MSMDEQNNQTEIPKKTTKEKAQEAGKDVVELAAKGAATYFGGPVGGAIADAITKTEVGQKVLNKAGEAFTRNPLVRHSMAKAQPKISAVKPVADRAIGALNGGGSTASSAVTSGVKSAGGSSLLASKVPATKTGSGGGMKPPSSGSVSAGNSAPEGSGGGGIGTPPPKMPLGGSSNGSDNKNEGSASIGSVAKSWWNSLPFVTKLKIIGIGAAIIGALVIVITVFASIPTLFLDYSNDVQETNDVKSEYEEYWADFCEEESDGCSEEQIEAAKELKESQEKFYEKLDSLVKKYGISNEQKYMVLTTVFYGYDINDFTEGNLAFELDDTDEIDYEVKTNDENTYEREKDSLKELIKQFKVNTAFCSSKHKLENGELSEDEPEALRDENNNTFSFNFFDKVKITFGFNPSQEGFAEAKAACERKLEGKVYFEDTVDSAASIEGYYRYLRESTYFDDKPHLSSYFAEYAQNHNLSTDTSTWAEEDLEAVRNVIIQDIKDIVEAYIEDTGLEFFASTGRAYWWPIGSKETTTENGVTLASGDPEFTGINSPFGMRLNPVTKIYTLHNGVDLQGTFGTTNIIAALGGTVINVNNSCDSSDSNGCGGGYGNYVEIQDIKGNVSVYAHMYKNSITVAVGDEVVQGQVLGKVGSSGNSTGAHLHFNIKINGEFVDPLDYIDAANPRPASYSNVDFNNSRYSREEFVAKMKEYYSQDGVCNSSSSQYVNGCTSFKNEILNNSGAETIYDTASSKNLNPELVVARSMLEGYSPGTNYNYFGYSCYNTGGIAACAKFTSFSAAMTTFFNNISQYDSVESMMSRYAYLGDYWYTGSHSDWGGCYYAPYIYPDGVPERVQTACAQADGVCTIAAESACVPTTQEDKDAYTRWQVEKMASVMEKVFG